MTRIAREDAKHDRPQDIAIVGAGFTGSLLALHLLQRSQPGDRIYLIERNAQFGRGLAYSTGNPNHLLNVRAGNMSAYADQPDHFVQWLRTRSEYESLSDLELRERFIPRMVYGDYVRGLMQQYLQPPAQSGVERTELLDAEAVDVEPERHHAVVHQVARANAGAAIFFALKSADLRLLNLPNNTGNNQIAF